MTKIKMDEVRHIANLARLEFSEKELGKFTEDLSQILEYINKLDQLETEKIEPTSHVMKLRNVVKTDESKSLYRREEILENAPSSEQGYFEVPIVLE